MSTPQETANEIVRHNLMTRQGYSPYCGATACNKGWPRSLFDGQQFFCSCGWRSSFPANFIKKYRDHWKAKATSQRDHQWQ